jgi:oligopeptide transport system substrate-binding protein
MAGITAGAAALAACTPQVVTQVVTQVVNQTQVVTQQVTQVVNQTSVVQVTPTGLPAIVTPQGRTLPPDAAPLDKQVFLSETSELKFFDPVRSIYDSYGQNMLWEPLIHNDENFTIVPCIAESWKAGPNTTYWEFVIRQGAIWGDGQPITADDVVFTWAHAANPAIAPTFVWFYYPIKGIQAVAGGGDVTLITDPKTGGVRKVDDRTVRIYGAGSSADGDPCPYMLGLLTYQAACILPQHVASKDELHWADTGIGLPAGGPYINTEWNHNASMKYEINPKYNGPNKVGMQHLQQVITTANTNAFTDFLSQTTYMIQILDAPSLANVRANPKLNALLRFFDDPESQYLSLNTFKAPLDNQKLRMALAKSIDRATLCGQVLNGTFLPGYTMLPPGFPAYNKDLESVQSFDVAAAQQLLSDAGYPKGKDKNGVQLTLELTDTASNPRMPFVQQQWQTNLGIKVNIKEVDAGTWSSLRGTHGMPIFLGQYEYDFIDPYNLLTQLFHSDPVSAKANNTPVEKWGSPRHPWYNADYDKACDQAGVETDPAKRITEYQAAETIQVNDAGQIFLTHEVIFQIWWPWVVGIPAAKDGTVAFRWLDITADQMYIHKDVDTLKQQYKGIA